MWNKIDLLTMVEAYADYLVEVLHQSWCYIDEEHLSEHFDDLFEQWLYDNREDKPAIAEQFNNWTDELCKEGYLHEEQYNVYQYVGKYSGE